MDVNPHPPPTTLICHPAILTCHSPQMSHRLSPQFTAAAKYLGLCAKFACLLSSSAMFGQGWRLGFLGLLHMDVFSQRLEQEFDADVIMTTPNVPYKSECVFHAVGRKRRVTSASEERGCLKQQQ